MSDAIMYLGDIGYFIRGKGIPKSDIVTSKGYPCIRYAEIYTEYGEVIRETVSLVSEEGSRSSLKLEKGDIIFPISGETASEIGKAAAFIGDNETFVGGDTIVLRGHGQNPIFLAHALNSWDATRQKIRYASGNSVVHIYARELAKVSLWLPSIKEQDAIVEILSDFDAAISLIKSKMQHQEREFQTILDKKLSTHITTYGTERLDAHGILLRGTGITKKDLVSDAGVPCLRYAEIYTDYGVVAESFTSRLNETAVSGATRVENGDVLVTSSGEKASEIGQALAYSGAEEAYCGGDLTIWRGHEQNAEYLAYQLNSISVRKQKYRLAQGHSVVHLNSPEIATLELSFPPIQEQTMFASYAKEHRRYISVLCGQLAALQQQRSGIMQQLLTGKICALRAT